MSTRIRLLIPYFGRWPFWMPFFLQTCKTLVDISYMSDIFSKCHNSCITLQQLIKVTIEHLVPVEHFRRLPVHRRNDRHIDAASIVSCIQVRIEILFAFRSPGGDQRIELIMREGKISVEQ